MEISREIHYRNRVHSRNRDTNRGITNTTNNEYIIDSGYLEIGTYVTDVSTLTLSKNTNQNDEIDVDGMISYTT